MNIIYRFFFALLAACATVTAEADDVLIRAAKVYTMTGEPLAPGAVLVSGGKIKEVGASIQAAAGVKVIDLGSGVLLPGFVDAYSSAGIAGNPTEITREITPEYRVLTAVDWKARAFREALAEGTTSVGLFPGTDGVIAGLACAVKTAGEHRLLKKETGLVITMSSDPAFGNSARSRPDSIYVRQPTNRMGVVWMLRASFDKATRLKAPEMATVGEALACERRMYAVSRTEHDLNSVLRLSKEFSFAPTVIGGHEAYKIREDLAAAKVPVILAALSTSSATQGPETTEVIWNQPGLLHKAGVTFALSGGKLLDQARFAVRYGLQPDAALRAVTSTPAKLLGLEERVGTIAAGRDADLVALDGDPFELTTSIQFVLVDGNICEKKD